MQVAAKPGEVIAGRYEVLQPLGAGGMGMVFRARHVFTNQAVALKVLALNSGRSDLAQERFAREATQQNQVDHPAIPRVLDAGLDGPSRAYLAMELLEGTDLGKVAHTLPFAEFLGICMETLSALAAVHEQGIVHRDIKPSNIFLERRADGRRQVRLLDFGIATSERMHKITAEGIAMGTVLYMSPEQARGEEVDRRTDLWSIGSILFRAATGQKPHPEHNKVALMTGVALRPPRRVHDVAPHVPNATAAVIDRALAFRREDRWSDAQSMRAALSSLPKKTLRFQTSSLELSALPGHLAPTEASPPTRTQTAPRRGRPDAPAMPAPSVASKASDSARPAAATSPLRPAEERRGWVLLLVGGFSLVVIGLAVLFGAVMCVGAKSNTGSTPDAPPPAAAAPEPDKPNTTGHPTLAPLQPVMLAPTSAPLETSSSRDTSTRPSSTIMTPPRRSARTTEMRETALQRRVRESRERVAAARMRSEELRQEAAALRAKSAATRERIARERAEREAALNRLRPSM